MSKLLRVVLIALLAGSCAGNAQQHALTLRVLTYNIHAGTDAAHKPSIARIAAFIDSVKPDVVLLQEVDRGTRRAGGADHLKQLSDLTHMRAVFGKALDFQGGEYGIALLSRFAVANSVTLKLDSDSAGPDHEPRVAIHAVLVTPAGELNVFATHLDAFGGPSFRRREMTVLLEHIKTSVPDSAPVIFGGDLNSRPGSEEVTAAASVLSDAFATCGSGPAETFPVAAPDRRIDYVFFRHARCLHARVLETQASDHRPVLATFEILRRS